MTGHDLGDVISRVVVQRDGGFYEERQRVGAIAECPRCGQEVELVQETDEWTQCKPYNTKRWRHENYGPSTGVCCGLLLASWWDGTHAYLMPDKPNVEPVDDATERTVLADYLTKPAGVHEPNDE